MSLYRQYRPQSFADVTGQEAVVTTLQRAVEQDQIAHAYLFSGPRGTGKTSIARILARHILTRGIEDETLKRQIEQAILDGNLVDLVEIDAASNRGIDDIRDLVEKIQFAPTVAKAKVYIVDEVHMLTREAFNALLKTLEEPPSYAYFILATTELQKIPPTIQSRCQRFPFRSVQEDQIVARLQHIAKEENIAIEEEALRAIAHTAQGGMRDAISLLDQMRSLQSVTAADVRARTGESGHERMEELLQAVQGGNTQQILHIVRAMEDSGTSLEAVARKLLGILRQELYRQADAKEPLTATADAIDALLQALRHMRSSPVPGLALEAALLRMAGVKASPVTPSTPAVPQVSPPPAAPAPAPQKSVPPIAQAPAAPAPSVPPAPTPATIPPPPVPHVPTVPSVPASPPSASGDLSLEKIFQVWPDIVNKMQPPSVKMSLKDGRVSGVKGNEITVAFTSAFHRDRVKQPDSYKLLEDNLKDALGTAVKVHLDVDSAGTPTPANPGMVDLAAEAGDVFSA